MLNNLKDQMPQIPPGMKLDDLKDAFHNMPSSMKDRLSDMAKCMYRLIFSTHSPIKDKYSLLYRTHPQ